MALSGTVSGGPLLTCLLPVRNGEADLPGWFDSIGQVADAVIALDDGSTDGTADILRTQPAVVRTITNPPRDSYRGWNDRFNRTRLLEAAKETGAGWVLYLDADERLDPTDGAALRTFVQTEALPGFAYGFLVHRMIGDLAHYDRAGLWVYRMFALAPEHELPSHNLHLVPVPVQIPKSRWLRTSIRIQHLAGLTAERRAARVAKYAEADPLNRGQGSYASLAEGPESVHPWQPRRPGDPVLLSSAGQANVDLDAPVLSAIVISRDDEARIERTVRSVVEQRCDDPFEVIVVTSGRDGTAALVRAKFPAVRLISLPEPALPGAARNAGLAVARGDYVSFPGSHVELPAGSIQARIRAHDMGWAMVTGTTLNGTPTRSGWANYFLDHSSVLPGRPSNELGNPPAHCSYARQALSDVGGFPEDLRAGEDTYVNNRLHRMGYTAYRAADVVLFHHTRCSKPWRLLAHHYTRGRAWGRILADNPGRREGRLLRRYVQRRLALTAANVERWGGDLRREYRHAYPLIVLGTVAAWVGTAHELAVRRLGDRSSSASSGSNLLR